MIRHVSITDVCDFQGGTQPPKSVWIKQEKEGFIRMLQIRDFTQPNKNNIEYVPIKKTLKTCVESDILIGRYGASIGKICTGLSGAYNVALVKTIPNENEICKGFLLHLLKGSSFQNFILNVGGRAAQAGFNKEDLKEFQFQLPPLEEQKRIAAILDAADLYRQKTKALIAKYDELSQSLFLEMFGDPVTNPKGWEVVTIRDIISEAKYGTSSKADENGVYPYLRMNNITYKGYMDYSNLKFINISKENLFKYETRKGDILFNRTNSKELVGKTGIVNTEEKMILAGYLIRVRMKDGYNPYFLWAHLNSKWSKLTLENMCKNIVGMANINAQELQNIPVLDPPINLQNQFAERVQAIEKQKAQAQESLAKAEDLFNSLLQRAFKGELSKEIVF